MSVSRLTNGINPDKLNQEINELGVRVRLYKSTICSNMKSLESMDHDINCTVCNNNMIDFDCKETTALLQQQDLTQQFKTQGTFSLDETMATFLSGETLQHYARVDLLDFKEDFFELIQRQVGTSTDRLKYSACTVLGVFVIRSNTKIRFYQGADFELDINGDITWLGSNKPNDEEIYSIYYQFHPIFRAVKAVHRTRYSQYNLKSQQLQSPSTTVGDKTYVKLPETWILKRDYLVERRDVLNALLLGNTYYPPNGTTPNDNQDQQ